MFVRTVAIVPSQFKSLVCQPFSSTRRSIPLCCNKHKQQGCQKVAMIVRRGHPATVHSLVLSHTANKCCNSYTNVRTRTRTHKHTCTMHTYTCIQHSNATKYRSITRTRSRAHACSYHTSRVCGARVRDVGAHVQNTNNTHTTHTLTRKQLLIHTSNRLQVLLP